MVTDSWISRILSGSAIRATPPSLRMSAGTRSSAITATAPASSAIRACSASVTSMITPPLSISARPDLTRIVPVSAIAVILASRARRSGGLVGEEDHAVADRLRVDEMQGLLVAGLAEEARPVAEHDGEDLQPQLVDEVVLQQGVHKPEAGGHDDFSAEALLQVGDLLENVALQDRRVVPAGIFERRGHDVLGQAVQPVCQLAAPGGPLRSEPLVAPAAQQLSLGAERLVERELVDLGVVLDQTDPAAAPEALVTGRVLDDAVDGDVLADHDPSHFGSPFVRLRPACAPAASRSPHCGGTSPCRSTGGSGGRPSGWTGSGAKPARRARARTCATCRPTRTSRTSPVAPLTIATASPVRSPA